MLKRLFSDEFFAAIIMGLMAVAILDARSRASGVARFLIDGGFPIEILVIALVVSSAGCVVLAWHPLARFRPVLFTLLSLPLLFFVGASGFYVAATPSSPRTALVLYCGIYALLIARSWEALIVGASK